MIRMTRTACLIVATLLAGCASVAPEPEPEPVAPTPSPRATAPGKPRLKPMPVRPLNVRTDCRFKDETGYSGSALLNVDYDQVKAFAAAVDIPRRGSCRFDLADFRQVKAPAHVQLLASNGCTVRMWEQGDQVTVAFSQCARQCTGNAAEYLWPILVDRPSGRCD
jgi:hypothetical protein